MSKLSTKSYVLYLLLGLVILWTLVYVCFAFVLMDFNAFNWTQATRGGFVFAEISILALSIPVSQLIKMEFD